MEGCLASFIAGYISELCPHAAATSTSFQRLSVFSVARVGAEIVRFGWAVTGSSGSGARPLPDRAGMSAA